jgi:hypothetical protein
MSVRGAISMGERNMASGFLNTTVARVALYAGRLTASYLVLARRFTVLYWQYVAAVLAACAIAWLSADAASDYTRGGWELHFEQRAWGLDLHIHHWYYGLPLLVIAFVLLHLRPVASVFSFVMGQALAAHSYHNEGGIPSIIEGGGVVAVPAFVYWPIASLLVALFTFFVVRSHEWLALSAEREEAAATYLADCAGCERALIALDQWGLEEFDRAAVRRGRGGIRTVTFTRLERNARGLWELQYAATPYDDGRMLLTVRIQHLPYRAESERLLVLLNHADVLVRPFAAPVIGLAYAPTNR